MKWEYKIVYVNAKKLTSTGLPEDINIKFDELGEEGWELIKVEQKLNSGMLLFGFGWFSSTVGYVAIFKRQKE